MRVEDVPPQTLKVKITTDLESRMRTPLRYLSYLKGRLEANAVDKPVVFTNFPVPKRGYSFKSQLCH